MINYIFLKSPFHFHGEFKFAKIFANFSKAKLVLEEN